mgnify:CR=1 FL=1
MADVLKKVPVREQDPKVRATNFEEVCYGYNQEEAMEEASRCINCKNAKCIQGCPVGINIPAFVHEVKEGNIEEAYKIIGQSSALPAVCGRVCPQESQCEGKCIRGIKGESISIGKLERFVADYALEHDIKPVGADKKNGHKVAVIGSGPAGLTCAGDLAKLGYDVTVFEALHELGGVLVYGIPEFRLSKSVIDRYKKKMEELGIRIRPNTVIGSAIVIDNLFRDGYSSVFVGTGVWRPKAIGIKGESLGNVYFGIDYLRRPEAHQLGEKVAVIGMGNVAMDVARTALRHGAKEVTLYARGKRISASSHEVSYTKLEGADFVFGKAIGSINEAGPMFKTSIFDENNKVIGYEEKLDQVEADSVIICVSQAPKNKLVLTTDQLKTTEKGLLLTDENCMTTHEGVFAAGDVVQGANTVVHAVEEAKRAAEGMIRYMEREENE